MKSFKAALAVVAVTAAQNAATAFAPPSSLSARLLDQQDSCHNCATALHVSALSNPLTSRLQSEPLQPSKLKTKKGKRQAGGSYKRKNIVPSISPPSVVELRHQTAPLKTRQRRKKLTVKKMAKPGSINSGSTKIEPVTMATPRGKKFTARLTREEEGLLSNQIRVFMQTIKKRDEMTALNKSNLDREQKEPTEREWATACGLTVMQLRKIMYEGHQARAALVSANAGLVKQIARKHFNNLKSANGEGTILSVQDLVQEGNLGIMKAAERFEPERGFRFSTYATWWIRQRILLCIADCSRVIRLPVHVHTMLNKINKAKKEMEKEIGREPSIPELAHFMNISIQKLIKYTESSRAVLSLEGPVSNQKRAEDRRTLGDKIAAVSPSPQEDASAQLMRQEIRAVLDELGEGEREVLVIRFGINDGYPKSVDETSRVLGISRDRVRMVEARALNKLRHPQRNYKLKDYVNTEEEYEPEPLFDISKLTPESIWSF